MSDSFLYDAHPAGGLNSDRPILCCNGYCGLAENTDKTSQAIYLNNIYSDDSGMLSSPASFGFSVVDAESGLAFTTDSARAKTVKEIQKGTVCIQNTFRYQEHKLTVLSEFFASQAQKELIASRICVQSDESVNVHIRFFLRAAKKDWCEIEEEETEDAMCLLLSTALKETNSAPDYACVSMSNWSDEADFIGRKISEGDLENNYEVTVSPDFPASFEIMLLCFTGFKYSTKALPGMALRSSARNRNLGYDELLQQQKQNRLQFLNALQERVPKGTAVSDKALQQLCQLYEGWNPETDQSLPMLNIADSTDTCWKKAMLLLPVYLRLIDPDLHPDYWFGEAFQKAFQTEMYALLHNTQKKATAAKTPACKAALLCESVCQYAQIAKQPCYTSSYGLQYLYQSAMLCAEILSLPCSETTAILCLRCLSVFLDACKNAESVFKAELHMSEDEENRMKGLLEKNHPLLSKTENFTDLLCSELPYAQTSSFRQLTALLI